MSHLMSDHFTWKIHAGDCIPHMATMPENSIDFSVFSPPFPSIFAYTSKPEDIGNSEDLKGEAKLHLSFFYRQTARILKPGRIMAVHLMQIPRMKRSGGDGIFDFRGMNIRLGERVGLIYDSEFIITKNPQSQAIRTKSRELQFTGLEADRSKSRPALNDYILKFRVPGENKVPINNKGETSRNDWIRWAEGVWSWHEIKETDTLNVREGRGEDDTKHICPLQLGVIRRLVLLYSMPGEIVFSPFAGIGSEGYIAVKHGRRFYGCEIKPEYLAAARKNMERAERKHKEANGTLFDMSEA